MGYTYFTIPCVTDLQKKETWYQDPDVEHQYSVIRYHCLLMGPFQLPEPVRKGPVAGASMPLHGITEKITVTNEYEVTTVRVDELIQEAVRESEAVHSFASQLSTSLGSDLAGKISSEVLASASQRFRKSFTETFKVSVSETHREKKSVTHEFSIDPSSFASGTTVVFVETYKAYNYQLYLQFIDYLKVKYEGSPVSLRLKRHKYPPVTNERHQNILRLDIPLASIRFWRQLPDSFPPCDEKSYKNEVQDPDEITIEPLHDNKRYPAGPLPPKPTLYDIAERVFPRRVWR